MVISSVDQVRVALAPSISNDAVSVNAGSMVYDNTWISYNPFLFKVNDYIKSVVRSPRSRFFLDRNHAVFLLVGIDINTGVRVIEGKHVRHTSMGAVPPPTSYDLLPLFGLILVQDGSTDIVYGYKPLSEANIILFSGYGNILDKDLLGLSGANSSVYGETGLRGHLGVVGPTGIQGIIGPMGYTGAIEAGAQGHTGLQGITGVSWEIHIPFEVFYT
jgi:hypothetical protein